MVNKGTEAILSKHYWKKENQTELIISPLSPILSQLLYKYLNKNFYKLLTCIVYTVEVY